MWGWPFTIDWTDSAQTSRRAERRPRRMADMPGGRDGNDMEVDDASSPPSWRSNGAVNRWSESTAQRSRYQPDGPILFFDKHEPYYEFTNFAPYSVWWEEQHYPTAEHLFQALKFLPQHPNVAERIRNAPTARAALQEAGRMQHLRRPDWFDVNVTIMDRILAEKFQQHLGLWRTLFETGSRELIEASPFDSFWGVGEDGQGRNELGKALMRLRSKMQR